ncbi:hypothetical protein J7F03_26615 [Streptomyces sp. ISL-43]|uniref:hypothetical protein n=1 Tax=Streptomyces sp. ISL-43 TaxID=2819183 RepID=UPI001BE9F4E6|nr:hypothetical protein [Streptomyces sp. ISL-43]MBT2450585.1 hypothetical protein [Streptomyces sp. ISL-43]
MPLPQPRMPRRSHRALRARERTRRHAGAAPAAAAGRRAVRRPPLLSAAGGPHPFALGAAALAALAALSVAGRAGALTHLWDFLDYGAGVLSLVSLTGAVLWGLAAADRTLLASGHRLVAQGVHRGLAVAGLGFLVLHVWIKVARSRVDAAGVVLPFADGRQPLLIGLGSLAGYLFVAVAVSGAVRSAFATRGRSLWWRALHMGAYPAWGASLVHGLKSGRSASGWVTAAYALCLVAVAGVLAIRLRARLRAESAATPRTSPRSGARTQPRTGPARPPAEPPVPSVPPVPARAPGQAPPRNPLPFVRRPAEWAAELLTARLARQPGPEVSVPGGPGPAAELPADWAPDRSGERAADRPADPYADPGAGPASDWPADPYTDPAAGPAADWPADLYADPAAELPSGWSAEPLDGVRGRR